METSNLQPNWTEVVDNLGAYCLGLVSEVEASLVELGLNLSDLMLPG